MMDRFDEMARNICPYGSFASDAVVFDSMRVAIAHALREERRKALEEAAEVAENHNLWPNEGERIARDILALIDQPTGETKE